MRTGALHKLAARTVKSAGPGMHSDGGGLFLAVKGAGARSWVFRFTVDGRKREIGLGSAGAVSLAEARQRAQEARDTVAVGGDPLADRRPAQRPQRQRQVPTFAEAADRYIRDHAPTWRSPKSSAQWRSSLTAYAAPLMPMAVTEIDVADVESCIGPIWLDKPETASRVRGRIERILGGCIARKERPGPNPAALSDNLEHILPKRRQRRVRHHAAVPIAEAQDAFAAIWKRRQTGAGTAALIAVALTALRSGEVRGLRWTDLQDDVVVIPADRMKAGRVHRVPVTPFLASWLRVQPRVEGVVFYGQRSGRPLSDMTLAMAMRRAELGDYTPHGWRSTFRDWAGAEGWDSDLAEDQLAHTVGSSVARAYRRADFLDRRRPMMEAWEEWITARVR